MSTVKWLLAAGACALVVGTSLAANPSRGELLFQTCSACHPITGDGPGPDLHGIYGRKSASIAGYEYSEAMRKAQLVWDAKTLSAFIAKPQEFVQGTKMTFPGYDQPADIAAVVAWLKQMR
jgi:cytochrome c